MSGGWGQWGSVTDHERYVVPWPKGQRKGRRRCYCGCGQWVTHRGMANGVCLASGCHISMLRWRRDPFHDARQRLDAQQRLSEQS